MRIVCTKFLGFCLEKGLKQTQGVKKGTKCSPLLRALLVLRLQFNLVQLATTEYVLNR